MKNVDMLMILMNLMFVPSGAASSKNGKIDLHQKTTRLYINVYNMLVELCLY